MFGSLLWLHSCTVRARTSLQLPCAFASARAFICIAAPWFAFFFAFILDTFFACRRSRIDNCARVSGFCFSFPFLSFPSRFGSVLASRFFLGHPDIHAYLPTRRCTSVLPSARHTLNVSNGFLSYIASYSRQSASNINAIIIRTLVFYIITQIAYFIALEASRLHLLSPSSRTPSRASSTCLALAKRSSCFHLGASLAAYTLTSSLNLLVQQSRRSSTPHSTRCATLPLPDALAQIRASPNTRSLWSACTATSLISISLLPRLSLTTLAAPSPLSPPSMSTPASS